MTTVPIVPLVLKNVLMSIGADNYEKALDQVTFTPSASSIEWTGLALNPVVDTSTATWTATLEYAQDWDTTTSLSRYLFNNEGVTAAASFSPRNGSGPAFTTSLVITPGAIGGGVNAFAVTSVTLGCTGKPLLVETGVAPTITSALPSAVSVGNQVVITGVRFTGVTGAAGVKINAINATSYTVLSDTQIVATMPAGTAGSAPIIVTNGTGASAGFAYTRGA
jgi:hypothetical protein